MVLKFGVENADRTILGADTMSTIH
ncbi:MAG: hypothetical protein RL728_700, partial [Bacteroidota bacterium]